MTRHLRIAFADTVDAEERRFILNDLPTQLDESNRVMPHWHPGFMLYYRVAGPRRCYFVKTRPYRELSRRIGRAFRPSGELQEFRQYAMLQAHQVPVPSPIAAGKIGPGLLPSGGILLLEWIDGGTLKHCLQSQVEPESVLLDDLIAFLAELHRRHVIHEDLKWDNIMVHREGDKRKLCVVDPVHLRIDNDDQAFIKTLAWFLRFLQLEGASDTVVSGYLERVVTLFPRQMDFRDKLLKEAQ